MLLFTVYIYIMSQHAAVTVVVAMQLPYGEKFSRMMNFSVLQILLQP